MGTEADIAAATEADRLGVTKRQVELACQRLWCVNRYREMRGAMTRPRREWLPPFLRTLRERCPGVRISGRSLSRWNRLAGEPARVEPLIDRRGGDHLPSWSPEAVEMFRCLYLHPSRPSARACWRAVRQEADRRGWVWPSYSGVLRGMHRLCTGQERIERRGMRRRRVPTGHGRRCRVEEVPA